MTRDPSAPLRKTPLNAIHRELGAKMVPFGGWDMPVQYAGILEEHRAVRSKAGLFDVSHMGEIELEGPEALAAVQRLVCNDMEKLQVSQVKYAALCTEAGTFVDDLTVARMAEDRFLLTVNASNTPKDLAWVRRHARGRVAVRDRSAETALLALQGPAAAAILQPLTPLDLKAIKYYWFARGPVLGMEAVISRTGYTGEDGFELYLLAEQAAQMWAGLLEAGRPHGVQPCGLGARDTLRLEAKMVLYGNDIDDQHTVLEADLAWIVKFDKTDFIGREALLRQRAAGVQRKLVGFEMVGRGIPRHDYPIEKDGVPIGRVTSGTMVPWLNKPIGLGYVAAQHAAIGAEFDVVIRNQAVRARVVPTPFYKRPRRDRTEP